MSTTSSIPSNPPAEERFLYQEALQQCIQEVEEALSALEARRGEELFSRSEGVIRVHEPRPLRAQWNGYLLELQAHLNRERELLPLLLQAYTRPWAEATAQIRALNVLVAEHEHLLRRSGQVRKAFLGVSCLRRSFTQLELALEEHARAQDTGLYSELFVRLRASPADTPSMDRYREEDPTEALRHSLPPPPPAPEPPKDPPWINWVKQRFFRLPKVDY